MDFVGCWSRKTEIAICTLVLWLGISLSKFYNWRTRYGKANEHNARVPRDHWLEDWEREAILDYERQYPLEGYRRLTFMMLDDDMVAVSPTGVYRVLKTADRPGRPSPANERKGKGFRGPIVIQRRPGSLMDIGGVSGRGRVTGPGENALQETLMHPDMCLPEAVRQASETGCLRSRVTVRDSKFRNPFPFQHLRNPVARESLRRGLSKGRFAMEEGGGLRLGYATAGGCASVRQGGVLQPSLRQA